MQRHAWILALSLLACGGEVEDGVADPATEAAIAVPDGKADNYLSTNGREYAIRGVDRFELARLPNEDDDAFKARALDFGEQRLTAITYFINAYVTGKSSHDENAEYGGFRTTVRQRSIAAQDLFSNTEGKWSLKFETEVAGPNKLLTSIEATEVGSGLYRFDLILPILTQDEVESGRAARNYRHFDGNALAADKRVTLTLDIEPDETSVDAFPEYAKLMDDGVLDVLIQIGGDYNDKRWDLVIAETLFGELQTKMKLKAPVDDYADLDLDSGPFTGEITQPNGTIVKVEVYLIHPGMADGDNQPLIDAFKAHAKLRDIVIYDGHAGYDPGYSGVVVSYHPRTAIKADDFADLDLPEKQQIFFFNGCKTYSVYPDALYQNEKKDESNLDIISTVNFSWLAQMSTITTDFLGALLSRGKGGVHEPSSYAAILSTLNRNRSWDVIYGVHGLDDNSHRSPYADVADLCTSCQYSSECGGGGNLCVGGACAFPCTADDGCPNDYRCQDVAIAGVINGKQCIPQAGICHDPT